MRFLMAFAPLAMACAFAQTANICGSVDSSCQQIEIKRLQIGQLQKQIEIQRQELEQQRLQLEAAKDHQMRLERLQRSMVTGAACLSSNTPDYCAARDPHMRAAKDDVASGRISEAEFIQAAQEADEQVRAKRATSP